MKNIRILEVCLDAASSSTYYSAYIQICIKNNPNQKTEYTVLYPDLKVLILRVETDT